MIIGWNGLPDRQKEIILKHKKAVLIFSHSSYFDFWLMLPYLWLYPNIRRRIRVLIKPQPFRYFGWFLRQIGAIPAPRLEDRGQRMTDHMIGMMQKEDECILMLSPKGTIVNAPWRSGYYHIADNLKVPIIVMGFDYHRHLPLVLGVYDTNFGTREELEVELKNKIASVTPLNPEYEACSSQLKPSVLGEGWLLRLSIVTIFTVAPWLT